MDFGFRLNSPFDHFFADKKISGKLARLAKFGDDFFCKFPNCNGHSAVRSDVHNQFTDQLKYEQ
jgi:hypothetical protein